MSGITKVVDNVDVTIVKVGAGILYTDPPAVAGTGQDPVDFSSDDPVKSGEFPGPGGVKCWYVAKPAVGLVWQDVDSPEDLEMEKICQAP